jgi:8-amino-7-oxononanoate synthase
VPEGKARLRVTLSALHTVDQVKALLEAIAKARDLVLYQKSLNTVGA